MRMHVRLTVAVLAFWAAILPMFSAHDWWQEHWFEALKPLISKLGQSAITNGFYMLGFAIEFTVPVVFALLVFEKLGNPRNVKTPINPQPAAIPPTAD